MIGKIFKDYSVEDKQKFEREMPKRFRLLCKIIGETALFRDEFDLAITLPFAGDYGCIVFSQTKDDVLNVCRAIYF